LILPGGVEMAEETSEKKTSVCSKTGIKVIIGIVLIIIGIAALIKWRFDLLILIRGCIGLFLIMAGAVAIAIAKE